MAKCGCGTTTCSCKVIAGANVTVTGSGSTGSPYVVSAVFDCDDVRTCFTAGDGIDGVALANGIVQACLSTDATNTIAFGTDGCLFVPPAVVDCATVQACLSVLDTTTVDLTYAGGVISGVVRVDPAGLITTNANGLFLNCAAVRTCFTGGDALNYDPLTGDFDVCLSTDVGNTIVLGTDGCLFVPAGATDCTTVRTCFSVVDTSTVDLTYNAATGVTSGVVIVSPDVGNTLVAQANGLFVPAVTCTTVRACLSVLDTTSVDMTYNAGTGVFSSVVIPDTARAITVGAAGVGLCLSTDVGNTAVFGTDGCLFVPAAAVSCTTVRACLSDLDTTSVNMTYNAGTGVISAVVIPDNARAVTITATGVGVCLSTDVGNTITFGTDGCLFVPAGTVVAGPCGITGAGTLASPLQAIVAAWPFACAQSANAGDVYCDPTTGQLQTEPPRFSQDFTNSSGTTVAATPVPIASTTVDTISVLIANPDPCRDLTVLLTIEGDVTFQVAPGSQINMLMNGDVMYQFENVGTTPSTQAVQQARAQIVTVPAGGVANPSFPLNISQPQGAGSTYTRVQWRAHAIGVSA